jgi:opacity protein-like surface antigen
MKTHMSAIVRSLATLGMLTCVIALPAAAQRDEGIPLPRRMEAGVDFTYARPVSQFRQNVRQGFGGGGHFLLGVDPGGVFGVRVGADFITYGNETQYFPLSSVFRRITLAQQTSNNIVVASVGPQFSIPQGPVRPYVNAGIGVGYFYTQSSLSSDDNSNTIATTTNFSDNSLAYTLGGGVQFPISSKKQVVLVDVGVRYNAIGRTRYLTKGDIQDDPYSGGLIITPHESDARFLMYRAGVSVRF